jgi:hypothetical protein
METFGGDEDELSRSNDGLCKADNKIEVKFYSSKGNKRLLYPKDIKPMVLEVLGVHPKQSMTTRICTSRRTLRIDTFRHVGQCIKMLGNGIILCWVCKKQQFGGARQVHVKGPEKTVLDVNLYHRVLVADVNHGCGDACPVRTV